MKNKIDRNVSPSMFVLINWGAFE